MTEPLSARAHARIIAMILSQDLPPGAALQEAKLAGSLAMSRTPVREAMKRIEAEGLARKDGRFLRVRRLTVAEVEEIFALREALEGFGARQAVDLPRDRLAAMGARIHALMQAGESEEQRRVDNDFHAMIARASGNATLDRTIAELRMRTCMFDIHQVPERFLRGCTEHLTILEALIAGDGAAAEQRMIAHVRNAGAAVLRRLNALEAEKTI